MSDSLSILIRAILEKSSKSQLEVELKNIEKNLKPIEVKTNIDSKNTTGLDKYKETMVRAAGQTDHIAKKTKEWTEELGRTVKQTDLLDKKTGDVFRRVTETTTDYKKQQSVLDNFNKKNMTGIDYQIKQRETQAQQFSKALQAKMLQSVQEEKITTEIHKQNIAQEKMLNTIRGMRGVNGAFITGDNLTNLNSLESKIRGFDPTDKNFSKNMKDANLELQKINTSMGIYKKEVQDASKFTGIFGQSIFEAGKKFGGWLLIGNTIMGVIRAVRDGVQSIVDIDTALTNLNKVTSESRETLNQFGFEANSVGRELAKTSVDVINATTEFARLGYSLQQSTQLAKQALLYSNVGDIGVQEASLAIISAVKGFGVEVDSTGRNVQKIVDIYNEVGNNFAISSAGIGEAMRRSSASLYSAGNTMEEAVALITAANSSIQDPAAVGTALKTISMR